MAFTPHQRNEIYANISTQVISLAPITSTALGEVSDNTIFAVSTEIYGLYFEMQNALALLSLDTTAGRDLDLVASEYPNLAPRQQPSKATGLETVTDSNITKISTTIAAGGGNAGDNFLNAVSTASFPSSGSLLVGTRGSPVFETVAYTSKSSGQFQLAGTLAFSHGSAEPIVKTTLGDRTFTGPFTFKTQPTASAASKTYVSTTTLIIYDGEADGFCSIQATQYGPVGNTPAGTINAFVGSAPFPTAVPTNGADITSGLPLESDADLRQRIRRERQALSSANIDAVTSTLFGSVNFNGQRIKFAQLVEDPDPMLPSIMYVDDGAGSVPSQASIATPIILKASANGGETHFRVPIDFMPIVTTLVENGTRVFSNITVQKNGVTMSQGDSANQYRVQPNSGILRVNTPLSAGDSLIVTALTYYSGLLGLANKYLYGDRDNRGDFPGVIGLGQWVQPRGTAVLFIDVVGSIILDGSRSLTEVVADIKSQMQSYINSLGIGNAVIKNRVQALGFVAGVQDFNLTSLGGIAPPVDVVVPDGTLAKSGTFSLS